MLANHLWYIHTREHYDLIPSLDFFLGSQQNAFLSPCVSQRNLRILNTPTPLPPHPQPTAKSHHSEGSSHPLWLPPNHSPGLSSRSINVLPCLLWHRTINLSQFVNFTFSEINLCNFKPVLINSLIYSKK